MMGVTLVVDIPLLIGWCKDHIEALEECTVEERKYIYATHLTIATSFIEKGIIIELTQELSEGEKGK